MKKSLVIKHAIVIAGQLLAAKHFSVTPTAEIETNSETVQAHPGLAFAALPQLAVIIPIEKWIKKLLGQSLLRGGSHPHLCEPPRLRALLYDKGHYHT
jgi:hypothetical protein